MLQSYNRLFTCHAVSLCEYHSCSMFQYHKYVILARVSFSQSHTFLNITLFKNQLSKKTTRVRNIKRNCVSISFSHISQSHTCLNLARVSISHVSQSHTSLNLTHVSTSHVSQSHTCLNLASLSSHTCLNITRVSISHVSQSHTSLNLARLSISHVSQSHTYHSLTRVSISHVSQSHTCLNTTLAAYREPRYGRRLPCLGTTKELKCSHRNSPTLWTIWNTPISCTPYVSCPQSYMFTLALLIFMFTNSDVIVTSSVRRVLQARCF